MKSGLSITGKIVEMDANEFIKLELPNGSLIELKMSNVERVILDAASAPATSTSHSGSRSRLAMPFKEKGYYIQGSIGFPFGTDTYGDPSLNISLMLSGGHTFSQYLALGIATGTDFYWWPNSVINPVALEVKGRFQSSSFTPYYNFQCGYGFLSASEYWTSNTSGGLFLAPGIGLMSKNREHSGWYFHAGFRYQEMMGAYEDWIWSPQLQQSIRAEIEERVNFSRLDLRFGYFFE
ncbi:MAG: hypothetical protein H6606_03245 [Flavobacteriales bacterium]|nr:hypothetical protein [Flavobacteriales bacterium]